jgi:hypothetical protein
MTRLFGKILGIIALAGFFFRMFAQDDPLLNAQRLVDVGAYDPAITEVLRFLFFTKESIGVDFYLSLSDLYREVGKFTEARRVLQSAHVRDIADTLRERIKIKIALIDIAEKKYADAELVLVRISSFTQNPSVKKEAALFLTFVYIYTNRWDKLEKALPALANDSLLGPDRLDSLIQQSVVQHHKSPELARCLSTFIPGLGQIYAHDFRNGLNALALTILTAWMTISSISNGYYWEAMLTDITLFWRYYSGNRQLAMEVAEMYNQKINRAIREKLIEAIASGRQRSVSANSSGR